MADPRNPHGTPKSAYHAGAGFAEDIDHGLRAYMLRVYNFMAGGLALTGLVAWFTAQSGLYLWMAQTGFIWIAALAPLGLVFYFSFRLHAMSVEKAQTVFWIYAGLMGLSLAGIFLFYTGASIARVFLITAAAFGALSLYGYTTKRDLSPMRTFLMISLFGIIIGLVVNWFMQSAALHFALSVIGVLVFAGLTAYDTQQIREMYYLGGRAAPMRFGGMSGRGGEPHLSASQPDALEEMRGKMAVMGALRLYLDFINMFIFLLHIFGGQRQ